MSIVIACDTGNLSLDDIFRLITAVDAEGNMYIRVYDDGTDPDDQYIKFRIINRDPTYALTLDAWIKQSLNNESIEFIEPYIE